MKNNQRDELENVIVRAWGDEPVKLRLHHLDSKRHVAFVGRDGALRPIGLPVDEVFVFEESTFSQLRNAYKSGNVTELQGLYASIATSIKMTYIDQHDQEHLADSEGFEGRNGE